MSPSLTTIKGYHIIIIKPPKTTTRKKAIDQKQDPQSSIANDARERLKTNEFGQQ
jgi:hypothetical protein